MTKESGCNWKVLSLYCGAGGIDEGLKQAGIETTLAIDHEKDCIETMKLNHNCETITGKVSDYLESFNEFDIIVGGPPCPEFSRSNPNRTFDLCEVNTFWSIIAKCKPKYFLMENVQDMKTHLRKRHYLIDCADYGVPENRVRCLFTNLSQPEPTHDIDGGTISMWGTHNIRKKWVGVKDVLKLTDDEKYTVDMKFTGRNALMLTRPVSYPIQTITTIHNLRLVKNELFSKKHTGIPIDTKQGRELTNEEIAILQTFPKEYKFHGSKSSVKRQIANAVPPLVIKTFFQQLNPLQEVLVQ